MQKLLETWVERGAVPGGVLLFGDDGREVETIAFGRTQTHPAEAARAVTPETVYDVASVTKPAATVAVLMKLVETGKVDLDARAQSLLPELTSPGSEAIEVWQLAGHSSGLPAHLCFYERLLRGERMGAPSSREALLRMAGSTALEYRPGERAVYSDLGFILLGFFLERAAGERLDALTARLVSEPLGMCATGFVDLDAVPPVPRPGRVAPTEVCPRRGLVVGEVHDDNAHAGGGVLGHAGLFSTAGDLGLFSLAMIAAARGEPGWFDPAVVRHCLSTRSAPDTSRVIGWDTPSDPPVVSHAGDLWSRDGVGHLGFTGCSVWLDSARGRYAVLLTNGVHFGRDELRERLRAFRRDVMDAVVRRLDGAGPAPISAR